MAGAMKEFFDLDLLRRIGKDQWSAFYAALICAGSDGENAARQIVRIATGWRDCGLSRRR